VASKRLIRASTHVHHSGASASELEHSSTCSAPTSLVKAGPVRPDRLDWLSPPVG